MIFDECLANAGWLQVAIFLVDAPADIETCKVAHGQRSHGVAEIDQRLVHGFDARTFFDQELSFAAVGAKHTIADKAPAVADEHAHFAQRF